MTTEQLSSLKEKTPAQFLEMLFQDRRGRNPLYSLSALSRDLGVSVSLLSRVMSKSRPMSLKLAMQIAASLGLTESESRLLMFSVLKNSSSQAKISRRLRHELEKSFGEIKVEEQSPLFTNVEIENFKAIAQWYHLAILNLVTLPSFQNKPEWIASQLGITKTEASTALDRLIGLGLLEENGGKLRRTQSHFNFKTKTSRKAVRKFHEQMIGKAVHELTTKTGDQNFQKRLINGITFTCGQEHIERIKEKIDALQDEILAYTAAGEQELVYQMNVQLFPLTSVNSNNSKEPQS